MIDPATGWFEMREIKTKSADNIANVLETAWLTRYPWPSKVIFDRGSEFKAEVQMMLIRDYGIKYKPTSVCNPQENAKVKFQNANCKIAVWPQAMIYIFSF